MLTQPDLALRALNALSKHVAVINAEGTIVLVNAAWRRFAEENGGAVTTLCEGANYLKICDGCAADVAEAKVAAETLRAILSGSSPGGEWTYACHTQTRQRWFTARAARLSGWPTLAIVTHEDITSRWVAEAEVRHLASHDLLTDLPNRAVLIDRVHQAIQRSVRTGKRFVLFFLDLDHFKYVNDAFGHTAGDELLRQVARAVSECLRGGDTIARMGGDEFAGLIEDLDDPTSQAASVATRICRRFRRPFLIEGRELTVTPSIGFSTFPKDGDSFETLLKNADSALYRAKGTGRNTYCFYEPAMSAHANERILIEQQLRKALASDQFTLLYQPQVELRSGKLVGVEALLRWDNPILGSVPPSRFIPIAEDSGLIHEIGAWVLREASSAALRISESGLPSIRVAVNISAPQFLDPMFPDLVRSVLSENHLEPGRLELELTESRLLTGGTATATILADLEEIGVALALDDFGTGYSSLQYLANFPFSRLKIDRAFTQLGPGQGDALVRAICGLASSFGMEVVAEGIETSAQLDALGSIGCHIGQGFFFAKPMSCLDLIQWEGSRLGDWGAEQLARHARPR